MIAHAVTVALHLVISETAPRLRPQLALSLKLLAALQIKGLLPFEAIAHTFMCVFFFFLYIYTEAPAYFTKKLL